MLLIDCGETFFEFRSADLGVDCIREHFIVGEFGLLSIGFDVVAAVVSDECPTKFVVEVVPLFSVVW